MADNNRRTEIFESMPVRRAVLLQIIPSIASQMVTLIYNLADTYFVGMLNDPVHTAAITVAYPSFLMLTAISNLFGVGGASAIARALGRKEPEKAGQLSALSFWGGVIASVLFSLTFLVLARPILSLSGAKEATYEVTFRYARWVVVLGGPFTVMNTLLANLVRAEGSAARASIGVSMGGLLNILLDPIFVLPQFLGLGAEGAGIATALSNTGAALYFLLYLRRRETVLSIRPRQLRHAKAHIFNVLSIGFPSAFQYAMIVAAVTAQAKFVSAYPTEAVAALGIAKKLDQLPLNFSIGVASGLLPLLAYNHSAGNLARRKRAFLFGGTIAVSFALLCVALYEAAAPPLVGLFIEDPATVAYGASFLRIMVTAMPLMAVCYLLIIQFQAMGRARESLICCVLRKGVLDIPMLFLLDKLLPLYGCMWVQPIMDTISLFVAGGLYLRLARKEEQ